MKLKNYDRKKATQYAKKWALGRNLAYHDYEKYGYENKQLIGLKNWYADYMTCNIKTSDGTLIGLDEIVYTITPPAESDFRYSVELEFNNEPENLIGETRHILNIVGRMFEVE